MTRRELLEAGTIPAWLFLFACCGALLGFVAWALSWLLALVKAL